MKIVDTLFFETKCDNLLEDLFRTENCDLLLFLAKKIRKASKAPPYEYLKFPAPSLLYIVVIKEISTYLI